MATIVKRPQLLQDLGELAELFGERSDRHAMRFLQAADETFERSLPSPSWEKLCQTRPQNCPD